MKKVLPLSLQAGLGANSSVVRRARRVLSSSRRSRLWKSVGGCLAGGLVFAVAGASWGATYTYTPTGSTTDTFSGGQDFSSTPLSGPTTTLTFVGNNATVVAAGTNTVTDDDTGAFQLNVLNLQGNGPASGTGTINIASSATTNYLDFVNNGGTGPVINLNANRSGGSTYVTYNITAPLQFDADVTFAGNGSGSFNINGGATPGAFNITKTGSSTVTFNQTSTTPFLTTGALTVNGGAVNVTGAGGNSGFYFAVGSIGGTSAGAIRSDSSRNFTIDYNGATPDVFLGTLAPLSTNGISPAKAGLGTLDLTKATYTDGVSLTGGTAGSTNPNFTNVFGTTLLTSLAGTHFITAEYGTISISPTASGSINYGSSSAGTLYPGAVVSITPSGSGGNIVMTSSAATNGGAGQFRFYGGTLALDPGSNTSLSLAIGNNTFLSATNAASAASLNGINAGRGLLIVASAASTTAGNGLATLGGTSGTVRIQEIEAGTVTQPTDDISFISPAGLVDTGIIGQNNDATKSGSFLTYLGSGGTTGSITHTTADQGLTPFTNFTAGNTDFGGLDNSNAAVELIDSNGATSPSSRAVFAIQDNGGTLTNVGTLSVGNATSRGGLILNGGSITGGTVNFPTEQGAIYVSGANGTISSTITTSSNGLMVQGPGVLKLTGTNTYTGPTIVTGSTLDAISGTGLPTTSLLDLSNGVLQSSGTFTRTLGTAAGNVNMNYLGNAAGGGFAARGGTLTVTLSAGAALTWGTTANFVGEGGTLFFGSPTADSTVNFTNALNLGGNTGYYTRVVDVFQSATSTSDLAQLSGVISSTGAINILAKTGAGTLALTNNNTYTGGTIVNQGTLLINNTPVSGVGSGTGTGAVTITGGALGGGGQIAGATSIAAGAKITGGTLGGVGTLTLVSNATINGTYQADILAGASDKLAIGGTLTIGAGAVLAFTGGVSATANSYDLANYTSETGTFASVTGAPAGYTLQYNTGELDLVSGAVPEPSTWVGGLVLMGMLGYSQRRRFGAKAGV